MRKYAVVPINFKQIGEKLEKLVIRSVLIEYETISGNTYKRTRYLDCSPYFNNLTSSLKYEFEDDGYTLIIDNNTPNNWLRMKKREYHTHTKDSLVDNRLCGFVFLCDNDEEAKSKFRDSDYYDCDTNPIILY